MIILSRGWGWEGVGKQGFLYCIGGLCFKGMLRNFEISVEILECEFYV